MTLYGEKEKKLGVKIHAYYLFWRNKIRLSQTITGKNIVKLGIRSVNWGKKRKSTGSVV